MEPKGWSHTINSFLNLKMLMLNEDRDVQDIERCVDPRY